MQCCYSGGGHGALDNCRPISLLQTIQKKKQITTHFYSAICTARRRVARALIQIAVINLSSSALRSSSSAASNNCAGGRARKNLPRGTDGFGTMRARVKVTASHITVGGKWLAKRRRLIYNTLLIRFTIMSCVTARTTLYS